MKGFLKVIIKDKEHEMYIKYDAMKITNESIQFFGVRVNNIKDSGFKQIGHCSSLSVKLKEIIEFESIA